MSNDITIHEAKPAEVMAQVNNVAGACKAIVGASCMNIQGRSYIKVEGWQAIAAAHGCTASADTVTTLPDGIAATATIRRLTDGAILGQAEGFVGNDETMWAKRPMFARRAMAQTRAISRACRSAFAHVVVAMNAGFGTNHQTTPAEEMGHEDAAPAKVTSKGEPAHKIPPWSDDQKLEAGRLRSEIIALDPAWDAKVGELRTKHKYDAPSESIDALAALLRELQDIIAAGEGT